MKTSEPSSEFPYASHFVNVLGSKIHYVDEGDGQVFLFIHGNPTSSYLWRNVIGPVSAYGRCIALDLVGFGRSDKPGVDYTFLTHYAYFEGFVAALGLENIVLVVHDWGGPLGFYFASRHESKVRGISFMETFPFTLTYDDFPSAVQPAMRMFRRPRLGKFLLMTLNLFVRVVIPQNVIRTLPKETVQRYRDPFPTVSSRFPVYMWPNELPLPDRKGATFQAFLVIEKFLQETLIPMQLLHFQPGTMLNAERVRWLRERIHDVQLEDLGAGIHYVQEDNPVGIAAALIRWVCARGFVAGATSSKTLVPDHIE